MALEFDYIGYHWTIRAGFPPMGSHERSDPSFVEALKASHPPLAKLTQHQLASWIVARLSYLTSGALTLLEGDEFGGDTNDFGFKIRITDGTKTRLAHAAVMVDETRVYFAANDIKMDDSQSVFVELLTDSPDDLSVCEIRVRDPKTRRCRQYGWNGFSLLG